MNKTLPKLTLVGAGPGDPELLTLKAVKALACADVVLYDALANTAVMDHCPKGTIKVYVGKRAGTHAFPQETINRMIVAYAFGYGHVVRLKGGDPFVFGRGGEEMEHAKRFGLEVAVVPGISSALAVPALCHVPLTHRGLSSSFWVLTATGSHKELTADVGEAARSGATVVILMGMKKLAAIMEVFKACGKGSLPVAIIQNGSLPSQRTCAGRVDNIVSLAGQQQIGAPAIILIGETAAMLHEAQAALPANAYLEHIRA